MNNLSIMQENYDFSNDLKYLKLLRHRYRNIREASEEIINLQAILNLPKGTEHFVSDIHGEYESFTHIMKNASGVIKSKIDGLFGNTICESERKSLATLVYYPNEKLRIIKSQCEDLEEWYNITLHRLVELCRVIGSKYTRSKVRKALPEGFDYIIDELLHAENIEVDKEKYYGAIIKTIIRIDRADEFIIALSNLIQRLAVDHLHIIGDIFDRGPGAAIVMDYIMKHHSLDIQWGNHDITWMGAAAGSDACMANVLRISARYDNIDTIEDAYGINIRPLTVFAMEVYDNDDCEKFLPKTVHTTKYSKSDAYIVAKIHKAITVIQFKLEGQLIMRHPEYKMDDRLLLDKIDFEKGVLTLNGKEYKLVDRNLPTVDPKNPYELTAQEQEVVERLHGAFAHSEKLQAHVKFLYSKGSIYNKYNSNLMFHGCIPMTDSGEFAEIDVLGPKLKGKKFLDLAEQIARSGYFAKKGSEERKRGNDFLWYLSFGPFSPLFGKSKMATFERYFTDDKELHKEIKNPYYKHIDNEETCIKIMLEFGLDPRQSHIINGHVPVKIRKGESPIKANGKLFVIDGGLSKAYQPETGIAGYTLIYNSHGLILASHEPFESRNKAIKEEIDIHSTKIVLEKVSERKMVADTDIGKEVQEQIADLEMLLAAFRKGIIKETHKPQ